MRHKLFLAILLSLASWQCQRSNTNTTGATQAVEQTSAPKVASAVTSGTPTSAMQPPSFTAPATGQFNIQMTPINVNNPNPPPAMILTCNNVNLYVYFPSAPDAANPQQVTIKAPWLAPGTTTWTYTDNQNGQTHVAPGQLGAPVAIISNTTGIAQTIAVTATVNGRPYRMAPLQPQSGGVDNTGYGMVTYSDNAIPPHQAVIIAEDAGIFTP